MTLQATETAVVQKTRELCETLTRQPEFQQIRQRIDAFMASDEAKSQYQNLFEKREFLEHKQQTGAKVTEAEIDEFNKQRDALVNNPIARGFLDAQEEMHKVQETVGQYVAKTFELGRLPTEADFDSGSCGPSCGCGH